MNDENTLETGDLVWHVDDLADGLSIPGLVTYVCGQDAMVLFADMSDKETHITKELKKVK